MQATPYAIGYNNALELELVNDALDAIYTAGGGGAFAAGDTSQLWSTENPEVKCDVCTLDSAVDNSIASHLLEGKNLNIHYSTYITQEQVVAGLPFSVNVNRSISRFKTMFISFFRARGDELKHPLLRLHHAGAGRGGNTV